MRRWHRSPRTRGPSVMTAPCTRALSIDERPKLRPLGRFLCTTLMGLILPCPTEAAAPEPMADRQRQLRAGACAVDISPLTFPVLVSGGFLSRTADRLHDPLHARCLVLDDGQTQIAIAVVDTLMMPRGLLDRVKAEAAKSTGIPPHHMLISATHSHSCPSVMGALGTDVDEEYKRYLSVRLVETIERAADHLAPAKVGWATVDAPEYTHCRRWIFRPDKMRADPFGERTVRAHMHPGYQNLDCIGPSGPADPELSILSVQSVDGRPLALLANYSMHYYGAPPVSADYYGAFCRRLEQLIAADGGDPPFVAMMSHGTSGDLHWMDYSKPEDPPGLDAYADALAHLAHEAWKTIEHRSPAPLAMAQTRLRLDRRLPDAERLAWAQSVLAKMGDGPPQTKPEVYAREALFLREEPTRELLLQAVRIGGLAITAIPCEVYGLTGLKLKALSPLRPTMNIELANGAEGYIPPPALYPLGGYNTWPARTAGLERRAEPKIVDAVLGLLEQVAGRPRREHRPRVGTYPKAVLASKPVAYWRMHEFEGPTALDSSGNSHDGNYEEFVVFHLGGPPSAAFSGEVRLSRAPHFAGGRMWASLPGVADTYSAELWFWNGLPFDARPVTGYMFSRGHEGAPTCPGDHLGIGGTAHGQGKLLFFNGNRANDVLGGSKRLGLRTWNHVVLVRQGERVTVYLNGSRTPEIAGEAEVTRPPDAFRVFLGGRCDGFANWEGRITEVALYDRALSAEEAAGHYATSGMRPDAQESW